MSKLYKYIKSEFIGEALLSASLQPSSSISVIILKTVHISLGSGFGFRGWTYATTAVTLAPEHLPQSFDPNLTACLNTGCEVIFVDRDWLLKCLPGEKINTMSTSLKVRGISTFKHESSEFAALSLYFADRNNIGVFVYVSLQYDIHLVEGL